MVTSRLPNVSQKIWALRRNLKEVYLPPFVLHMGFEELWKWLCPWPWEFHHPTPPCIHLGLHPTEVNWDICNSSLVMNQASKCLGQEGLEYFMGKAGTRDNVLKFQSNIYYWASCLKILTLGGWGNRRKKIRRLCFCTWKYFTSWF